MDRRLVSLGLVIALFSLVFYPGFYYEPSPKGEAPVLSDRVLEALQRGEKTLNCIVWVRHKSTIWEKKVNLIMSLAGAENIGVKVTTIYPALSSASVTVPAENVHSLLQLPNVYLVDLDAPVRALGAFFVSVDDIMSFLEVQEIPKGGDGVDVYVLDTGAPTGIKVDSAVTFVGGSPYDVNGHGSAVIAIIRKLAPRARIHSVKVLRDDGTGSISTILEGLEYVLEQPGEKKVVNASLGLPESTVCSLKEAFSVFVLSGGEAVVAAGNDPYTPMSPGTCPEAITVGAISGDNRLTEYSYRRFDVVAYGDQIGLEGPFKGQHIRGTSFAAPVVTGLVARYMSVVKGTTAQVDMEKTLKKGSASTPEGYLLPKASMLVQTPPVPEREIVPAKFFLPVLLAGVSLVLAGFFSPKKVL